MKYPNSCRAMTLPEVMATVTILGLLAAMALGRFAATYTTSKGTACHMQQAEIELQTQLWHRAHGSYPSANLSNIGANASYFPEGLPICPVDGTSYSIDSTAGTVVGHSH